MARLVQVGPLGIDRLAAGGERDLGPNREGIGKTARHSAVGVVRDDRPKKGRGVPSAVHQNLALERYHFSFGQEDLRYGARRHRRSAARCGPAPR